LSINYTFPFLHPSLKLDKSKQKANENNKRKVDEENKNVVLFSNDVFCDLTYPLGCS